MNYFAENALPIWVAGAVLVTIAVVVFLQTRALGALVAVLLIAIVAGGLLVAERLIETPREAVERTLDEIAAAIEANDLPAVLGHISPSAGSVRSDAETLMPLVTVEKARVIGTPEIVVDNSTVPPSATVQCQAMVNVVVKQNGMKGPYMDRVTIEFVEGSGSWLIQSYTPAHDWRREVGR